MQHSPDLSFGDVSIDGNELLSDEEDEEEDVDDERESHESPYSSSPPSDKGRLRSERRRRRSQLDVDRRTPASHSHSPHEIRTLSQHNQHSRHSFSSSASSPHLSSQQHSRRSSTTATGAQSPPASADLPLHDAHIATLLLPLSTSLPLPTLHSRLSSLRSALHASHRQLTEYRSLLSDKQQQQAEEKQINYDLFMKVKEQDEHIQWLTHSIKQSNSSSSSTTSTPSTDTDTDRLTLRGMRGVALHAAHMQLREMMGEVDKRATEIRRLEEQVRTLKIEKEARSEGDSNEIERLRQEVAVLMGKLTVEAEERELRDRVRSKQERKQEKQLEKLRQRCQSLEHDLLQSTAEVNTLSSALSTLRSQHSALTFDHQRLQDDKAKVEQERGAWQQRYEDVMDEVDTMRSEMREAREVSDGIGRLVEGSESLELRRVRDECEKKVTAMQEEVRAMERAVMDTKRGMDAEVEARAQQQTATLHDELRQLRESREKESEQWTGVVADTRQEREEAEAENEQLRQRLRQLTQQLEQQATQPSTVTSRPSLSPPPPPPPQNVADERIKSKEDGGSSSVDPSLLSVLRAELDSVRAINQRVIAAQQQADNGARSQLEAARKQLNDMESRVAASERMEQELRDELSAARSRMMETQRQHKQSDDEQKHRDDEKDSAVSETLRQQEQQWQYERNQMLQSLTALTAESKEREALVSKLMDNIAQLEHSAQRSVATQEREKQPPPTAADTLSSSLNGHSSTRHPQSLSTAPRASTPVPSDRSIKASSIVIPSSPSPAIPAPISATSLSRPALPLSPATAGELLSDSLLDQLASRLAAKLTHSDSTTQHSTHSIHSTRSAPARPTSSSTSTRTRRSRVMDDGDSRAGGTARAASSADIAAEMAAIYRQLEGKSRTFSHFAQQHSTTDRHASASHHIRNTASTEPQRRSVPELHADAGELKEVEQDDYIPLIRRIVGGQAPHPNGQPVSRRSLASTHNTRLHPTTSYVLSPTTSIASSASASPSTHHQSHSASPPMSPCSLSPSLSSSAASSSLAASPPLLLFGTTARVSTGARVLYGGSVKLKQQQQQRTTINRGN